MVSLEDIIKAQKNISNYIYKTPQIDSIPLSKVNQKVSLKLESIQITGSFKLRGAINKLLSLNEEQKKRGVIAVSTGNHGKGVAYAAKKLGIKSKIFMSELVLPEFKKQHLPYGFKVNAFENIPNDFVIDHESSKQPNSVLGVRKNFDQNAFRNFVIKTSKFGANLLGGCCEIKPKHIESIKNISL